MLSWSGEILSGGAVIRGHALHPSKTQVGTGGAVGILEPLGSLSGGLGGTQAAVSGEALLFG